MLLSVMFPGRNPQKELLRSALIVRMVCNRLKVPQPSDQSSIFRIWTEKYPQDGYAYVAAAIVHLMADNPELAYRSLNAGQMNAKNERSEIGLAKEKLLANFPELHLLEFEHVKGGEDGSDLGYRRSV